MPQLKIELPRFGLATCDLSCSGRSLVLPFAHLEVTRTKLAQVSLIVQSNGHHPPKQRCRPDCLVLVSLGFIFHCFCPRTRSRARNHQGLPFTEYLFWLLPVEVIFVFTSLLHVRLPSTLYRDPLVLAFHNPRYTDIAATTPRNISQLFIPAKHS